MAFYVECVGKISFYADVIFDFKEMKSLLILRMIIITQHVFMPSIRVHSYFSFSYTQESSPSQTSSTTLNKEKGLVACSESTLGEGFPNEIELLESFPDCQDVFCFILYIKIVVEVTMNMAEYDMY